MISREKAKGVMKATEHVWCIKIGSCNVSDCLCLCVQESNVSKAVKSMVTMSTLLLCGLIVIYHAIEVQVRRPYMFTVYSAISRRYEYCNTCVGLYGAHRSLPPHCSLTIYFIRKNLRSCCLCQLLLAKMWTLIVDYCTALLDIA